MQQTMPGMSGLSDAAADASASDAAAAAAHAGIAAAASGIAAAASGIPNDCDDDVSSNRSIGVKKLLRHVIPVEYWIPSAGVWTESAQLSLSRGKTKLYIDIQDNNSNNGSSGSSLSLNNLSSYSTTEKKQKLHNLNRQRPPRRLKFTIDQTLRIEHNVPLAKDFHVTLSGGGALIRHKVAFFAEDEAVAVVSLLDNRGVQVIRKRRDLTKRSNFTSGLRPISEGFEVEKTRRPTPPPPAPSIGTMAILRRKSTGSFDKQQSHLDQRQSQRQLKNSMSTISSALLQRRNSMASRTKKADSRVAVSPTKSAKTAQQTTKWYEEIDYYDDEEIEEFNRETSTAKNSRHSLETDEDSSEHEKEDLIEDAEAADEADGVMAKLFHPTRRSPSPPPPLPHQPLAQNQPHRPRAPTSEKLEKYKFMLINIEPDADILDPGTFALMQDQDSSSYLGFEFNDYPSEVLCPPFHPTTQQQEEADSVSINSCCSGGAGSNGSERDGGLRNSTTSNSSPKQKPNRTSFDLQPTWIRRSYEQLHSVSVKPNLVYSSGSNYNSNSNILNNSINNPYISQSTGNLASHKSFTGTKSRETNSGKKQNEQQSETNNASLSYNSESGSNKEAGGGGQLQQDIRRQLLSSGSPTLTSECL